MNQYSREIKIQEGISKKLEDILLLGIYKGRTTFKHHEHASISIDFKYQVMSFRKSEWTQKWKAPIYSGAFHSGNPQPLAVLLTKHYTKYHFSPFPPFLTWLHIKGKGRPSFPEESLHSFSRHIIPWISQMLSDTPAPSPVQLFAKQHINLPSKIIFSSHN